MLRIKMAKKKTAPKLADTENLKLQLARALADYDNLAKRTQSEAENITKVAQARVILRILPVFDMLISAQGHLKDQGLELVIQEFKAGLSDLGVEEINAEPGQDFDPELHEAIDVRVGEEGKIMEVARNGYIIDDKVLRHAQVVVGRQTN